MKWVIRIIVYFVISWASYWASDQILTNGTKSGRFALGFTIFWVVSELFEIRLKLNELE